jgi:hypothetical protein
VRRSARQGGAKEFPRDAVGSQQNLAREPSGYLWSGGIFPCNTGWPFFREEEGFFYSLHFFQYSRIRSALHLGYTAEKYLSGSELPRITDGGARRVLKTRQYDF